MDYFHHPHHNTGIYNYVGNVLIKSGRPTLVQRLRDLHSVIYRKSCTLLHC